MKKLLLVVAGLLCAAIVSAAEFSPGLDAQLRSAQSTDLVSAIVMLPDAVDIRALDMKLHEEKAGLVQRHKEVLAALKYNAELTQPAFRAELDEAKDAGAVTGFTAYWIENLFVIQATREFVESLRERGDILSVSENFSPELAEAADVHAPQNPLDDVILNNGVLASGAYRVNTELGITGEGTIVANLDTGVDGNHPALEPRWRGLSASWQQCWHDLGGGTNFPNDPSGHGTHTMGVMAGYEVSGMDTIWSGCAPHALWIAAKNDFAPGDPSNNGIIDAFQWFADPDGDPGTLEDVPDVVSNNWGVNHYFPGYTDCFDFWNAAIQNCEAAGPVIIFGAGAEGPAPSSLRTPANYSINAYQNFAVGTADGSSYPNGPYPIASFSSRGPTPCVPAQPDNIKPEMVSPGINIYSLDGLWSGHSFAAGHVAGVIALMREACPDCDYITIKEALMNTAIDEGTPGQDNTFGHGFIDGYAAVLAVMPVIDDLTIHAGGGNIVLRWSPVAAATSYQIFTSPTSGEPWTLLGSATEPTYTDINPSAAVLSYHVRATLP